jgi:hypothetical protein
MRRGDTKSGALFLGFGHQLSVTYTSLLSRDSSIPATAGLQLGG